MWIELEVLERDLTTLLNYLMQDAQKCPFILAVIEERLDEVRECRRLRESRRRLRGAHLDQ